MTRRIENEITIQAPMGRVFDHLTDPHRQTGHMPGMIDVRNVVWTDDERSYDWTYKMLGIPFDGRSELLEYEPPERWVIETTGGIGSRWTIELEARDDGTRVIVAIQYSIPMPVLGRFAEAIAAKQNEREMQLMLLNAKEQIEALAAAA